MPDLPKDVEGCGHMIGDEGCSMFQSMLIGGLVIAGTLVLMSRMIVPLLFLLIFQAVLSLEPSRDTALDQLKAIRLPHIFSPAEGQMIMNQLDTLKLGIDLFLSHERQLSPQDQQLVFASVWPLLKCLFRRDFDRSPSDQTGLQGRSTGPNSSRPSGDSQQSPQTGSLQW